MKYDPFPCRANEAILRVRSYEDGRLTGRVIHSRLENPKEIHSVPQLVLLLDEILLREEGLVNYCAFEPGGGIDPAFIATLRIRILFREHYSWQGSLLWEEQQQEATFRSVLELIQLLDEVLGK